MDEEDGRPGPRARKLGPADVLTDACAGSLRDPVRLTYTILAIPGYLFGNPPLSSPINQSPSLTMHCRAFFGADLPEASPRAGEGEAV